MEKSKILHFFLKKVGLNFFSKNNDFSKVSIDFSIVSSRGFKKVRSSKNLVKRTIYKKSCRVLKFF